MDDFIALFVSPSPELASVDEVLALSKFQIFEVLIQTEPPIVAQ
jgi:hypothetical protein